jgi:hypothetical protein
MAQVVECPPSKHEACVQTPVLQKKKKKGGDETKIVLWFQYEMCPVGSDVDYLVPS